MTEKIKNKGKEAGVPIRALLALSCMLVLVLVVSVFALDTDLDSIEDDYENFFSANNTTTNGIPALNYIDATDGALNFDSDSLVNSNEFAVNTDPFVADTDRDGFDDDVDDNPASRAYIDWGEEFWHFSLTNDAYDVRYAQPVWLLEASKIDGTWQVDPTAFYVVSANADNAGAIIMEIDRSILTNDVVLSLDVIDYTGATLYVDLYDTNGTEVATNLFGNILSGTDMDITIKLDLPLSLYPSATLIVVGRGVGEITIYRTAIYVDEDGDGLDAEQELQLGTLDTNVDSDFDGIMDPDEPEAQILYGNPVAADPVFRVMEYYLTTGDFVGTTYNLTLDQDLASDYFVLVRGSRTGDDLSTPDNDYARVISVPGGRGDLSDSGVANVISLSRQTAAFDWEGVVTVVECLENQATSGFRLLDALDTPMSGTSGSDSLSTLWTDITRVVPFGGYRGAGAEMASATSARDYGVATYVQLTVSGTNTLSWTRDAAGETLLDATMTTFVVEWGSEWTVQYAAVSGSAGGGGADASGEYTTSVINPVARDNTWIWGTGTHSDAGIGDCAEACLVTLGDGVNQNLIESTVAVGSEYTDNYTFDVYTMTHAGLAVDYVFKADGDQNVLDKPITVDVAPAGARFGWNYNTVNGTGDYFPRNRFWARYTDDSTVTISRGFDGQNYVAWVQGIDFSSIGGGAPQPNQPPIADAGFDVSTADSDGDAGEVVTLDGSGSYDPDGSIVSYEWLEGSNTIATGVSPSVALAVGAHNVTLMVTDDGGATDSDSVTVTVDANVSPTSDAGVDQVLEDGDENGTENVTLVGSGSTDSDGTIVSYSWFDGTNQIATGVNPSVDLPVGTNNIELVITDNGGAADNDFVTITISVPAPPSAGGGFAWMKSASLLGGDIDVNVSTATALEWVGVDLDASYFEAGATPDVLTVKQAGDYLIAVNVPVENMNTATDNHRTCIRTEVFVNGVAADGAIGESSYSRANDDHQLGSDHVTVLLPNLSFDDEITVKVQGTAYIGDAVNITEASLYAEYIDDTRTKFFATTTGNVVTNLQTATESPVLWDTVEASAGYTHASSNPDITLDEAGDYLVFLNVPIAGIDSVDRQAPKLMLKLDGTPIPGAEAKQGYIRANTEGNDYASLHYFGLISTTSSNQVLSIGSIRESTAGGTVLVQSGKVGSLYIEKINASSKVYKGSGITLEGASANWNPSTPTSIEWTTDEIIDSAVYGHSVSNNAHQITVNEAGDYLLIYNDDIKDNNLSRGNPCMTVEVNGSPVPGANIRSHYLRDSTGHDESSGSLVFMLNDLNIGDAVEVSAVNDRRVGAVDDSCQASIVLIQKESAGEPPVNVPPISDAGSDQVLSDADDDGSETVTLDGSGSSDSDGTIVSYEWLNGTNQIATGVNPSVDLPLGINVIILTVIDNDGEQGSDAVEIVVNPAPVYGSALPFIENFETNTVTAGNIDGQNNWTASGVALVRSEVVYEGNQALQVESGDVSQSFAPSSNNVVWTDMHIQPTMTDTIPTYAGDSAVAFYFNTAGNIVVSDGGVWTTLTNHTPIVQGDWVRLTVMLDYSTQKWLVCLNGIMVAENLSFESYSERLQELRIEGGVTYADHIAVAAQLPAGLSLDGDILPDEWEQAIVDADPNDAITGIGQVNSSDDFDGDGATNRQEFDRGTDPTDPGSVNVILQVNAATGDDNNNGIGAPFATIGAAITATVDGDTIEVAGGTYSELPTIYDLTGKSLTVIPLGPVTIE